MKSARTKGGNLFSTWDSLLIDIQVASHWQFLVREEYCLAIKFIFEIK